MPIYEYKCEKGHSFEALQSMSDGPIVACEVCQAPVERVFHPIAVHFKGSGFYTTDYKKSGKAASSDGGSTSGDGDSGSSKSEKSEKSTESKKPEKKKDSAAATT